MTKRPPRRDHPERTEAPKIKQCTGALRALQLNLAKTHEPDLRARLIAAIARIEAVRP